MTNKLNSYMAVIYILGIALLFIGAAWFTLVKDCNGEKTTLLTTTGEGCKLYKYNNGCNYAVYFSTCGDTTYRIPMGKSGARTVTVPGGSR